MAMKVKKDDNVLILSGKQRGQSGKVIATNPKQSRVMVDGVNIVTKHTKPRHQGEMGGRIQTEAPIAASNVMPICAKCNKATRVGFRIDKGTKTRICKKCGESLDN